MLTDGGKYPLGDKSSAKRVSRVLGRVAASQFDDLLHDLRNGMRSQRPVANLIVPVDWPEQVALGDTGYLHPVSQGQMR